MTDFTRSSTLSLRRSPNAVLTSRPKPATPARDVDGEPGRSRSEGPGQSPMEPAGRSVSSDALLQGRSHVSITHNGETYQLRATRLGKLILTK
ncbi:hemin uptake protein HemP [Paraburkholderia sartisoli]|uniref:Hemin uptake protein HemP n=1 Tax=Paraburkholderia sartisoli TaxID=83784 RepID=A0A1H4HVD1_9BURK|nr:hemin uptake protein HemP [Paraburkholderia sartisoli]SEB25032.1 Hemin uptake protein HemP [Paraburkholderia sartisoli]